MFYYPILKEVEEVCEILNDQKKMQPINNSITFKQTKL